MTARILYRSPDTNPFYLDREAIAAREAGFEVIARRSEVDMGDLVIGRYSVLPYYKELEDDIHAVGAKMINSYRQHQFVADVMEWAPLLGDLTPKTYDVLADLPEGKAFVVKGQTNSRKDRWNTHMFAANKAEAINVTLRLQEDSLISQQKIYYREYVPLYTFLLGHNGLPITDEYRFFVLDNTILCGAYYWSSYRADLYDDVPKLNDMGAYATVNLALQRLIGSDRPRFLVVDVARTANGRWIVIELNDGQMSGLSENHPGELYVPLHSIISQDSSFWY